MAALEPLFSRSVCQRRHQLALRYKLSVSGTLITNNVPMAFSTSAPPTPKRSRIPAAGRLAWTCGRDSSGYTMNVDDVTVTAPPSHKP